VENNQFNEQVKNRLEHHSVEPSAAVWDRIQAQLDKDAAAFDTGNLKRFWWFSAAMLTIATVILAVWYSSEKAEMVAYHTPAVAEINLPAKNVTENIDNELIITSNSSEFLTVYSAASTGNGSQAQSSKKQQQSEKIAENALAAQTAVANESSLSAEEHAAEVVLADADSVGLQTEALELPVIGENAENNGDLDVIQDQSTSELAILENQIQHEAAAEAGKTTENQEVAASEDSSIDQDADSDDLTAIEPVEQVKKQAKNPFKGFYIGLNGGYYASTLLNSQNVVINDNTIETGVRFGPSKGMTLGYVFANNLSIQAEYLYNVIEGQNYYMEDVEGAVKSKAMTLYYDQVPLTVKLQTPRYNHLLKKPASVNILAGAQLNILKDYQIPQERRYDTEEDIFRPTNFSFLAGAEYQMLITSNIMISLGVQGTISENFSTSNDPLGDFQKHSLTTGAKGGIYYHF
jgi:hypothetical protein